MVDPWGLEQTGTEYHYEINGESSNRTVTVTTTTTRQGWIRSLSFGLFGSPNVTTTSKTYNVDQTIPTLGMTGQEFIRTSDTGKLPAGVSEAQVAWQVTNTIMVNEALDQAHIVAQDTITGAAMSTAVLAGTSLKNIASKAANSAEKAASKCGAVTVLGKYPDYLNKAEELGAKRFNVPKEVWKSMTPEERWAANRKFLDRSISRGDEIVLSNKTKSVSEATGSYRKELEYLESKGYTLTEDGMKMIPPSSGGK